MIRLIIGITIGMGIGALLGHFGKCSSGTCPLTANPFRGAIYGGVMGALFSLSMAGSSGGSPGVVSSESPNGSVVKITSADQLSKYVLSSDVPCLVDFYSDHCGPCRRLAPTIVALSEAYSGRALICKVSLDAAPKLAEPYAIRSIPAVLFFDGGKEVDRLVGLQKQSTYEHVLDSLISKRPEEAKEDVNADL